MEGAGVVEGFLHLGARWSVFPALRKGGTCKLSPARKRQPGNRLEFCFPQAQYGSISPQGGSSQVEEPAISPVPGFQAPLFLLRGGNGRMVGVLLYSPGWPILGSGSNQHGQSCLVKMTLVGRRDLNLGPHACLASSLPLSYRSSSQSPFIYCLMFSSNHSLWLSSQILPLFLTLSLPLSLPFLSPFLLQ